jgi:outer membrane protein OmpA-like peptidoglycan-associated protein
MFSSSKESSMKKNASVAIVAAMALLSGCADTPTSTGMSDTGKGTLIGAGVGAVAGAVIGGDARGAAIGAGVGAVSGYAWSRYMENKKAEMQRATAGTGVQVTQTPDNQLKMEVPSDFSFDVGRADIKPNMRPILDQFAQGLGGQPNTEVRVVGHTDSTGSDALNDRLSLERAESVRNYLADRGVNAQRIVVAGRGKREPIADNATAAGRARNRRVEIFLGDRSTVAGQ